MATEPAVVYRTTDPNILAAWDAETDRRDRLYRDAVAFAAAVDPERKRNLIGVAHETFMGLEHRRDWSVPRGWKAATTGGTLHLAPDRRTKTGRAAAAHLARLSPGDSRSVLYTPGFGLPTGFFGQLDGATRYIHPGVMRTADALYTMWAVDPTDPKAAMGLPAEVDTAKWQTVPLSVYYTAREQRAQERAERDSGRTAEEATGE